MGELVVSPRAQVVTAEDFLPLMTVDQAVARKQQVNQFIGKVMIDGDDYGYMPGDNKKEKKKVLLKPGAEKLCSIFGLAPRYEAEQIIEDWTGKEHGSEPLFYYRYKCQLYRGDRFMGEAVGSSNSWEAKHRYRWLSADQVPPNIDKSTLVSKGGKRTLFEFIFAFDKRETTGQYGKPEEHWQMFEQALRDGAARNATRTTKRGEQHGYEIDIDLTLYRVPNDGAADVVNTCQKIAQKRALVAAVLIVTNCSDAFTQDLEDGETPDTGGHPIGTQAAADHVAQTKVNGGKIDPALASALAAIDKKPESSFPIACEQLYKLLAEKHGGAGAKTYDDICMKFSEKFPKGCKDKQAMKDCIKDLWMEYERPIAQPVQEVLS
jgi:hypothetical protein